MRRWALASVLVVALIAASCGGPTEIVDNPEVDPADPTPAAPEASATVEPSIAPSTAPSDAPEPATPPPPAPTATATPEPTPGPPPPPDLTKSPSVFFAPVPPRPPGSDLPTPDGAADFMELFQPDARWADAAARIDGFKIHSWMIRHYLSDDDLVTMYTALRDRGIPLIIEAEPLDPPDPAECNHTESFEGPYEIENLQRLKSLDIEVAMVAIEQPYSFGHRLTGPGSCQYELSRVVDEVVAWVADARAVHPDLLVGSIEAIWSDPETSPENFAEWLDAYEAASGEQFAFINVDPNTSWSGWGQVALGVEAVADERSIPFGILFNGGLSTTNDEYLLEIAELFAYYEGELGGTPDQVWIQSWHELPDRLLPDDDAGAMTSLVNRYFGARARFEATEIGGTDAVPAVTGRLVNADGAPLTGRTVVVEALPVDGVAQSDGLSGTVPSAATEALVAVRVNAEDADPGDASVVLHSVDYREGSGESNAVPNGDFAAGLASWGVYGEPLGSARSFSSAEGPALNLFASEQQQIWIDGNRFPVEAGADFEFSVGFMAPAASAGTVTVAVIFLDGDEVSRSTIVLGPRSVNDNGWSGETDASGAYSIELDGLEAGLYELAIRTDGDSQTWVASTAAEVNAP